MHSLILISAFFAVVSIVYFVYLAMTTNERHVKARMKLFTSKQELAKQASKKEKRQVSFKEMFRQSSSIFKASSYTKKMEVLLSKADIPLKGEEFVMLNLLLGVLPAVVIFLITTDILLTVIMVIAGLVTPRLVIKRAMNKRINRFNEQVGEALGVMSNSLKAGFSFLQAMELVSKEMPAPISVEFARALREMNLGTTTEKTLVNMSERIGSDDLDLVLTAVLTQRQVGGNLSEILDNIAFTIRERIRVKGEIKTLTAQGRISGMVISILPLVLGLVIYLLNPEYIQTLFTTNMGFVMIGAGIFSELIGFVLIRKIVNIKV